jgi:ribosomal protein S12 methylthiotransferase
MLAQQPVSLARNQEFIGKILPVLAEGSNNGLTVARSYRDAPEIDGYVLVEGELPFGEISEVQITGAMTHDLTAVMRK